jgi:diphosphomevalonate decarboxylase
MAEDTSAKKVSTTEAMAMAATSPYFSTAVTEAENNIVRLRQAMNAGDWSGFGKVVEDECYRLHAVCMTQTPNVLYWRGVTIEIFQSLYHLREQGIEAFFTVDAGPHVHVVCQGKDIKAVKKALSGVGGIKTIIECGIGEGAKFVEDHLF